MVNVINSFQELETFLKTVKIPEHMGFYPIDAYCAQFNKFGINLGIRTIDIEDGSWTIINNGVVLHFPVTTGHVLQMIREKCLDMLQHEFDEHLLVDEKRVFNPHKPLDAAKEAAISYGRKLGREEVIKELGSPTI